jgi:hypothetical protein
MQLTYLDSWCLSWQKLHRIRFGTGRGGGLEKETIASWCHAVSVDAISWFSGDVTFAISGTIFASPDREGGCHLMPSISWRHCFCDGIAISAAPLASPCHAMGDANRCPLSVGDTISIIVPDMSGGGQLAFPRVQKKLNSSNYVMYICSFYIRYHPPIMFTCIAVLSHLVVKGGYTCEIWVEGTNNKLLGGQDY